VNFQARPWSYQEVDGMGKLYWTGYCIDFAHKLSELMGFDYEIIEPELGTFGQKDRQGKWDGVVGDLASGV
jgi:glutamate receptor, ionotropic, invertebrate